MMKIGQVVLQATLGVSAVAVVGCQRGVAPGGHPPPAVYAHNLKHVRCQKQIDGQPAVVQINSLPPILADPDDATIFVCPGDTVRWITTDPNVASFTVDFTVKVNGLGLFTPPAAVLKSQSGVNEQHTQDQTVAALSTSDPHYIDYVYSICVNKKDGTKIKVDPHVIPTGN